MHQYFKLDEKNPYTYYIYIHNRVTHTTIPLNTKKIHSFWKLAKCFPVQTKENEGKNMNQGSKARRRRGEGTSEEIIRTLNANLPFKRSVIRNKKYCHVHTYAIT